jgi:hypothetical protein
VTKANKLILGLFATVLLGACSPPSAKLLPKPLVKIEKQKLATTVSYSSAVDILFVIDDSYSMDAHQRNLARNIDLFVDEITKNQIIDYHIGSLNSSIDTYSRKVQNGMLNGTRARFVTKKTVDGINILKENLKVGTGGSATEMMFDPVVMALTPPNLTGYNQGFYRPDGTIAVIFITDAEDQSDDMDRPNDFYQFLLGLKNGDKKKVLTYGAFIPTNDTFGCERDEFMTTPLRLEEFFSITGGLYYNLCDPNFGMKLSQISQDISAKVGRKVYLDRPPDLRTLIVRYGTQVLPNDTKTGWTYDPSENALILGSEIVWDSQPSGTSLEVEFDEAQYPIPKPDKL